MKTTDERAKAWANYVKVRDRETAKCEAIVTKTGPMAYGGISHHEREKLKERITAEVEARYAKEIAAAEAKHKAAAESAKKTIDAARAAKKTAIDAAWQAFEVLDVGGRTKRP